MHVQLVANDRSVHTLQLYYNRELYKSEKLRYTQKHVEIGGIPFEQRFP